jgi:preprotein translocase subunit SecF
MKGIRFIPDDTNIPFMRFSRFGFFVSGILCALSILLYAFIGLNVGVDFKGGTDITIRTEQAASLDQLRNTLNGLGLGAVELQEFGSPNDILIRIGVQDGGEKAQQDAVIKIKEALGPGVEYLSIQVVGPKVSGELAQEGIIAVVLSIICVLIYIWFAMGAVLSLLHDVLLTIGLFCLIGLEFNLSIIAAILTIVGYSLNDTVVVFDRIREFLRKYKTMPLADLLDFAINSVLPRTIMTSLTTLLALISLYLLGGEVIHGFAFAMIWGVVVGTYSSFFIASPVLILLGTTRETQRAEARAAAVGRP